MGNVKCRNLYKCSFYSVPEHGKFLAKKPETFRYGFSKRWRDKRNVRYVESARVVEALRMREAKEAWDVTTCNYGILKMPLSTLFNEAVSC
jgi:hypothetical protein